MVCGILGIIFLILGLLFVLVPVWTEVLSIYGSSDGLGCIYCLGIIFLIVSLILFVIQMVKLS